MREIRHICLISFIACLAAQALAADPLTILRDDLERVLTDRRLADAQIGIKVISLDKTQVLYEKNASKLYMPASNNKILTAAVALTALGPEYRFKTQVLGQWSDSSRTALQDLIIIGYGDPSSSSRSKAKDPFQDFRDWAEKLKRMGVTSLSGSLLGLGTAFEETSYGRGWGWDDLTEGYAAPISALQFNENILMMEITPGPNPGSYASIKMTPLPDFAKIQGNLMTEAPGAPSRIKISRHGMSDIIRVSGMVPQGSPTLTRTIPVQSPIIYYLVALRRVLEDHGIDVSNCRVDELRGPISTPVSLLWTHYSQPLSEVLAPIMKMSLNLGAETLVRILGLELRGEGSFERGKEVVEATLASMGIRKDSYSYADGSGLSRLNLVSAEILVQVLDYMYLSSNFRCFYDALAVAGVDGTLAGRMRGTRAENNVRAKTGTFANVSAISGYVRTADGEMLAFSILVNNYVGSKEAAEAAQDKALSRLARFSRKDGP